MRALGFETLLGDNLQAPIIVTFRMPADPAFVFQAFYDALKERGYVIYPGKLTVADSFRIGCIGRLYPEHMRGALGAIREILAEMGVTVAEGGGVRRIDMNIQRTPTVAVNRPRVQVPEDADGGGLHRRLGAGLYRARDRRRASRRISRG